MISWKPGVSSSRLLDHFSCTGDDDDTVLAPRSTELSDCLACCCFHARGEPQEAATNDRDQIKGTWQLVYAESEGKVSPVDRIKNVRVKIKDGTHSVYVGDQQVAHDIPFTMDPKATPRTTDNTLTEGADAGKQIHGIYELDGDTLMSCVARVGEERPKEFATKAGTGHTLRVFMRVRPDEAPKEKAIREELMRFGGTWHMVEFRMNGEKLPSEAYDPFQMTLHGNRWWTKTSQGTSSGTFKIDPTQSPKTIDIVFKGGPQPEKIMRGIYELTSDTYKVCVNLGNQPRPTELVSSSGSQRVLEVLKRESH